MALIECVDGVEIRRGCFVTLWGVRLGTIDGEAEVVEFPCGENSRNNKRGEDNRSPAGITIVQSRGDEEKTKKSGSGESESQAVRRSGNV